VESATLVSGTNVVFETFSFNGGDVAATEEELAVLTGITFRAVN
jgi:hypothetical protein